MNIPYNYIQQLKQLSVTGQGEGTLQSNPEYNRKKREAETEAEKVKESTNTLAAFQKLLVDIDNSYARQALTVNNVIGVQRDYATAVVNLTKRLTFLEQRNKELNKTFGINSTQATKLGTRYDKLAVSFGVSGKATRKYGQDLNKILPGLSGIVTQTTDASNSLIGIQNAFQQQLGLSGDVANNFIRMSGGSTDVLEEQLKLVKSLEHTTGLQGLARDMIADMANLAPQIQLQFSRIPGSLELAVLKARTLGVSFDQIAAIGNNLLDVEGSINNELEYQLVSGKRLVDQNGKNLLNQFRTAALTGNANEQAEALNKIIESQGDTLETNVLARQQLAKTLGIEESKLASMVQQRKLLRKLGPEAEQILKLQGEELTAAVEKFEKEKPEQAKNLQELLKVSDTRTTDKILIQTLKSIEAKLLTTDKTKGGLRNVIDETGTETEQVAGLRKLILTDIKGSITDFTTSGKNFTQEVSSTFGLFATATETLKPPIEKLAKVIPLLDTAVTLLSGLIGKITKSKEITALGDSGITVDTSAPDTQEKLDAIVRVNDAVLFDPNDKINIVASTSQGTLDRVTSGMNGGNSGPSAKEIGQAVAQALQGVNLYVSPNELAAEMAFNSYNINA